MARKLEVHLDSDGIREFLSSSEMESLVKGFADKIAGAANGEYDRGFHASSAILPKGSRSSYDKRFQGRASGFVSTATPQAKRLEATEKTLEKAISQCS